MSEPLQEIFTLIERDCRPFVADVPRYVVGVNGMDGSGKTWFARGLADHLRQAGHPVELLHVDDFNNNTVQREVYEAFISGSFAPEHLARFYDGSIDYARAARTIYDLSQRPGLVVVEGVFLYKDELVGLIDYKILLEVEPRVAEERFRVRRMAEGDTRPVEVFGELWLPCHERYVREREPRFQAHLVIDNNDFYNPVIKTASN